MRNELQNSINIITNFIALFALAIFVFSSCSPKGDGSLVFVNIGNSSVAVVNLDDVASELVSVPLSSLLEYCNLVQLESVEEAYVNPWTVTVSEKYIGIKDILSMPTPYKLFERSGNFLTLISSHGGGPGEFQTRIWDDAIDDENELVYLVETFTDRVLVYSTSGVFLKEFVMPHLVRFPSISLHDKTLMVMHVPLEGQAKIFQFDVNTGELLNQLSPPAHLFVQRVTPDDVVFNSRNVSGFVDVLSITDTLYRYDMKNNELLPFFTMPYSSNENIWKQYMVINKDIVITRVHCFEESGICRKSGLVAVDLRHKTSSFIQLTNDFFGNLSSSIDFYNIRNGYWTQSMMPEELMDEIEDRLAERDVSENDRTALNKMLVLLQDGANNLVFIGKLKE